MTTTNHHHNRENMKAIIDRMSRAIGHFESVKKMVEEDRDCSEVLIQLSAVKSAVNNIGREILKEHLTHCILDVVGEENKSAIEALNIAIERFIK